MVLKLSDRERYGGQVTSVKKAKSSLDLFLARNFGETGLRRLFGVLMSDIVGVGLHRALTVFTYNLWCNMGFYPRLFCEFCTMKRFPCTQKKILGYL